MNVFLSWSGDRSREVAEAFYKWLPTVINSVEPFISRWSIEKGVVGQNELSQSLEEINFGIICLTKENLHADWILYEAGALSKFQKDSRVWTFLLDIKPENISEPLSKFQHTNFEKSEVFQLLQSINIAVSPDKPLNYDLLKEIFEINWERLNVILSAIKAKESAIPEPVRDPSEINMEVLNVVRKQEKITQKLLEQNDYLNRNLIQIVDQISRPSVNPYTFSPRGIAVTDLSGNVMQLSSVSPSPFRTVEGQQRELNITKGLLDRVKLNQESGGVGLGGSLTGIRGVVFPSGPISLEPQPQKSAKISKKNVKESESTKKESE